MTNERDEMPREELEDKVVELEDRVEELTGALEDRGDRIGELEEAVAAREERLAVAAEILSDLGLLAPTPAYRRQWVEGKVEIQPMAVAELVRVVR